MHIIKLVKNAQPDDEEADAKKMENKGLTILAVIKDSPAAKAGLIRGDVLMKFAGNELNNPEELSSIVRQYQGQDVAIEYERSGNKNTTKAQINTR